MFFVPIIYGFVLGIILFSFIFITTKRNGNYYLAPVITFLTAIALTFISLIFIGGFEGMGYGLLAGGILLSSVVGTMILPVMIKKTEKSELTKKDQTLLIVLPIIFMLIIASNFLW